jgi:hypothetical protein
VLALCLVAAVTPRGDPAARLSTRDEALEYWDFVASFEQGHRLAARVLITNEGPGQRTAVAVGHLLMPDGSIVGFRNGRLEDEWSIEPDARRLKIGSSELDLRGPVRTLVHDNNRRGIHIVLRFASEGPARSPSAGERREYHTDLLDLATPVEGSVFVDGMAAPVALRGRGSISHTWMDASEPTLVLRRLDFASSDGPVGIYLQDLTDPGGARTRWLVVERAAELIVERTDFEVEIEPARPERGARGYPVPTALRLRGSGLSGRIALGRTIVEHEPLGDLPQPFRFLLSFAMRPRRVWTDASFSLRLDAAPGRPELELAGSGIASVTYLNPLVSPAS